MLCKICGTATETAFRGLLLKKHDVAYYRCPKCDFMQTEEPYWLEEAYTSAISDLDLGPVNRALVGSRVTEAVIVSAFDPNARFIDWGGGYGVFTRLMRDMGYEFFWHDPLCTNLFAKHFSANLEHKFELMTSFEVFEHLPQPMAELDKMFALSPNILFTTLLPPHRLQNATEWWYLALEHGQHIAIYSLRTLKFIADHFGVHLTSDGVGTHLFSTHPVSDRLFRVIARDGRLARTVRRLGRRKLRKHSLLMSDFRAVTGWDV